MNPERRPIIHTHSSIHALFTISFFIFIPFAFPGCISPSYSSQLHFLDRASGCGLREASEANRLRKTVLARPITPRQSTLHVIVLGIHAWLTEWVLMRLGNDMQERKKHSSISLMDCFTSAHTQTNTCRYKHTHWCTVTVQGSQSHWHAHGSALTVEIQANQH